MTLQTRDWRAFSQWMAERLKEQTGDDVALWNARIREAGFDDEASLRAWLTERG